MALESWDWFLALAEHMSFTRTAEELNISQQTLSARLAALEKELDAKLFVRKSPMALTPAGEAFLGYAIEQAAARIKMERRVDEASEGATGLLKVAISNMRGHIMMPAVISEFHKGMPKVRIELIEGTNEEIIRLAERGEVDLAVARFDRSHPGVTVRPLFEEEVVVAVHPDLLASSLEMDAADAVELIEREGLSAMHACPFLLEKDDDLAGRIGRTEMKRAGIKHEGVVKCESMAVLLGLASKGLGAVFCPETMFENATELSGNLVCIRLKDPTRYEIGIGRPADAEPWTAAQMFEDTLGSLYGE